MIYINYVVTDHGSYEDGPYEKIFDNYSQYYDWLGEQRGHPFLSIKVLSTLDDSREAKNE